VHIVPSVGHGLEDIANGFVNSVGKKAGQQQRFKGFFKIAGEAKNFSPIFQIF